MSPSSSSLFVGPGQAVLLPGTRHRLQHQESIMARWLLIMFLQPVHVVLLMHVWLRSLLYNCSKQYQPRTPLSKKFCWDHACRTCRNTRLSTACGVQMQTIITSTVLPCLAWASALLPQLSPASWQGTTCCQVATQVSYAQRIDSSARHAVWFLHETASSLRRSNCSQVRHA